MLQLGHETDCTGSLMSVNWMHGGAHPRAYDSLEISPELCACLHVLTCTCSCMQTKRQLRALRA